MNTWSFVLMALLGTLLHGQVFPKAQDALFWEPGRLIRIEGSGVTDPGAGGYTIVITSRDMGKETRTLVPPGIQDPHLVEGLFYAHRRISYGKEIRFEILQSGDGKTWNIIASLERTQEAPISRIFCIDGTQFLLIATTGEFVLGKERSRLAGAKIDRKNRLAITGLIEMEGFVPLQPKSALRVPVIEDNSYLPLGLFIPQIVHFDGGLLAFLPRLGYFWTITGNGERLKVRHRKLFSSVEKAIAENRPIEPPILGCQPDPDGSLLLASRDEAAVLMARLPTNSETNPPVPSPRLKMPPAHLSDVEKSAWIRNAVSDFAERLKAEQQPLEAKRLKAFPHILWWTISSDTGAITKLETPENAPSRIEDVALFKQFRFHFRANGSLLIAD